MTDREMLEAAARAAGIRYDPALSAPHPKSGVFWGLWLVFDGEPSEYARRYFNSLTDDGDAFRLAVKLNIRVCPTTADGQQAYASQDMVRAGVVIPHGADPYAATRRAITRAAAAIGGKQ